MRFFNMAKYTLVILLFSFFVSCSKNDEKVMRDELEGLQLATTLSYEKHQLELYTKNGKFQTGYNAVYFQIKNADGSLVSNATASWQPVMHMTGMSHSCPASAIGKKTNAQSTYGGFIVFQMAGNDTEYWELAVSCTIDGKEYTAKKKIAVVAAAKRVVESFKGTDGIRYILAMVEPVNPRVAANDMKAVLYKMETMMSFVPVDNYRILIDPRMPGMGNHGSPNNTDLVQGADKAYHGKLSLTMSGYWKINLQLADAEQHIVKGEPVTSENESSSIYFETEF